MRIQQYLYNKQLRQSETPQRPKAVSNTITAVRRPQVERPLRREVDAPDTRGTTT
jgi:hypothetical protein